MMRILIVIFLYSLYSCEHSNAQNKENKTEELNDFFKSNGVVSFQTSNKNLSRNIHIYNLDGSQYCTLNFEKDLIKYSSSTELLSNFESNFKNQGLFFDPYELYPDYFILKFEYDELNADTIFVFIDKEHQVKKGILKDNLFKIEDWKSYFGHNVIDFDPHKNSLKKANSDIAESVEWKPKYDDLYFEIVKIEGEWIYIQCTYHCGISCDTENLFGWVRWKKDNILLVKFPSAC